MNRTARTVCSILLAAFLCRPSVARVWYVARSYSGGSSTGESWHEPARSIAFVLLKCSPGDQVRVAAGTYAENVVVPSGVTLLGGFPEYFGTYGDPDIRTLDGSTVISGVALQPTVTIADNAGPGTGLDGFTITGGKAPEGSANPMGGGVYSYNGSPVISRCTIRGNTAQWGGGVALLGSGSPRLIANVISGNTATSSGGGVYVQGALASLEGNIIRGNTAIDGGGVCLTGGAQTDVTSCVLAANTATRNGGGCFVAAGCAGKLSNDTFANNTAVEGGAAAVQAPVAVRNNIISGNASGIRTWVSSLAVEHNCFHENGAYDTQGMPDPVGTGGNFSADPGLAPLPPGDFHLAEASPCHDAGDDGAVSAGAVDADGKPRLQGAHVDIGADETSALIIRVAPSGDDSADGQAWATAKRTIQASIDAAAATGGEIWAQTGVYAEHITLPASVALYGGFSGAESRRAERDAASHGSVLDAGQSPQGLTLGDSAGPDTVLDGFTVCNAASTCVSGPNASAIIRNNTFSASLCGVTFLGGSPVIVGNRILTNSGVNLYGTDGGWVLSNLVFGKGGTGVSTNGGPVRVAGNTIRGCGTGAYLAQNHAFVNNTVYGNATAIWLEYAAVPSIDNNILANNGVAFANSAAPSFPRSNCIYGSLIAEVSGQELPGRNGNIGVDPKLVPGPDGSLRLAPDSPCRDSGASSFVLPGDVDADGKARIVGAAVDMGADEFDGTSYAAAPTPIVRVKPDGDDALAGDTWATAKRTVPAAIEATAMGGEVWVAGGVYLGKTVLPSGVALYGGFAGSETARDQRDWRLHPTVLDPQSTGPVVSIAFGSAIQAVLDGFTIRNGNLQPEYTFGAGGVAAKNVFAVIRHNTITGCITALSVDGGSAVIENNVIAGNGRQDANPSASVGIKVAAKSSVVPVRIANNVLVNNAGGEGTLSVTAAAAGRASIFNNTIIANSPSRYGALVFSGAVDVAANLIAYNSHGVDLPTGASVSFHHNDVFANSQYDYNSGVAPAGTGNISADPRLAAVYGDVHIQPDSPCRNAGDPAAVAADDIDMDGQPRVMDGRVDIGADESDGTAYPVRAFVVRVSPSGDDARSGDSWATAKRSVQAAITAAQAASGGEVWVAAGTYAERLNLPAFVSLYGGFTGTESTRDQRNWSANVTILDAARAGTVITVTGGSIYGAIDGFTIRRGVSYTTGSGGGIWAKASFPAISNNTFVGNEGDTGGAINLDGGAGGIAVLTNNAFVGNVGTSIAGAIFCDYGARMTATGCRFIGNLSSLGSAITVYTSGSTLRNCTLVGNKGPAGAVLAYAPIRIENSIVAHNSSGFVVDTAGSFTFQNDCLYDNGSKSFSGVPDPTGTNGNIDADPRIASVSLGNVHLRADSPCIDAGSAVAPPEAVDMDGQPRVQGARVDIGADESDGTRWTDAPGTVVRVSTNGSDTADGSSWATAKRSIQAAIDAVPISGGEVWVAGGVYRERLELRAFCHVYGGFGGTESALDGRRWAVNPSILDGEGAGTVVTAPRGAAFAALDGFTVRNGATGEYGGGIGLIDVIATVAHNTITANTAGTGAGICTLDSSCVIQDNLVYGNTSLGYGGGMALYNDTSVVANNTIVGNGSTNASAMGAGVYITFGAPVMANNIIVWNSSGIYNNPASAAFRSNCIAYNAGGDIGGMKDFIGADGNISIDPQFADRAAGDFRLLPTSRCIEAGRDADATIGDLDLSGAARVQFAHVDIGAYESSVPFEPGSLQIVRVSPAGSDANTGASWDSPLRTLSAALQLVAPAGEVWLAKGTYIERNVLTTPVALYGGFSGGETERGQRDAVANISILDGGKAGSVLIILASATDAIVDGLTLTNGSGIWVGSVYTGGYRGGAVYCDGSAPILRNNTFRSNLAHLGGAVSCGNGATPEIRSNLFTKNGARTAGAAVYCSDGSAPVIADNTFAANDGDGTTTLRFGPLFFVDSAPIVRGNRITDNPGPGIDCSNSAALIEGNTITGNTRTSSATTGGGVACTGLLAPTIRWNRISGNTAGWGAGIGATNSALISNNLITGNTAAQGGGGISVTWVGTQNVQPAVIRNNTVVGNTAAPTGGSGLWLSSATVLVENNIFAWGNGYGLRYGGVRTATMRGNLVYANASMDFYGFPSPAPLGRDGNFKADPLFVDRTGGDYHLQAESPALDGGFDGGIVAGDTDLDGQPRLQGLHVEIGAYELPPTPYSLNDVRTALRLAGGLASGSSANIQRVNVEPTAPNGERVTIHDAIRLLRKAVGRDPNP